MRDSQVPSALASIGPLRPSGHATERDLGAALKDVQRALDAGQSTRSMTSALQFGALPPSFDGADDPFAGSAHAVTRATDTARESILTYVRSAPTARADALAPSWARGFKPAATRGPFLDARGLRMWIDTFVLPRALTIQTQSLFGGPARFLVRLPLGTRPSPTPRRRLGPGSVWLPAQVLVPGRPANEFVGVEISGGTVAWGGIVRTDVDSITLSGAWKVVLRLRLRAPANPAPGPGPGIDASQAVVALPATVTITIDATAPLAIAFSDATATAYAADVDIARSKEPPFHDALSRSVVIPGGTVSTPFDVSASRSTLFKLAGAGAVARDGWSLGVVVTSPAALGQANGAGSLWFELAAPLRAQWTGLARQGLLTRSILRLAPGSIDWSAQTVSGEIEQTLRLWDEPAADPPRRSSATVTSTASSVVEYVSVPGFEAVLLPGKAVAHLDRPIVADGARLAVRMPDATLGVLEDMAGTGAALIASDVGAQNRPHLALALENALLKVRPPQLLFIAGPLNDDRFESGRLVLALAHRMVLPTLPDPYAANFEFDRQQDSDRGVVVADIAWPSPQEPKLAFSTVGIDSASAAPVTPFQPNAVDFGARLAATVQPPPQVLLDVSSNADQFGVAIPRQTGLARVQGLSLVAEADTVGVVTLPPISWEPMLTKAPPPGSADIALQPPPHDGGIAGLSAETKEVRPIEPIPLLATYEAAIQASHHFVARLPLPFGLTAAVATRLAEPQAPLSSFIAGGGSVYFNRPTFSGQLTGGLQLGLRGAPASDDSVPLHDPRLPGYVAFTDTDHYAESVLSSDIYDRFGADFGRDGGKGIPLRHYELSGYGASLLSDWRDTSNPGPSIIEARFDVLVGRTAHEVIQMQSTLYPWFARVVRTITIDRRPGGWLLREDSGWVPTTQGEFEYLPLAAQAFDPTHRHVGAVRGVRNIRNIRLEGPVFPTSSGPNAVTWQAVRFDADVAFVATPPARLVLQGGSADRSTPSREISGWIQIGGAPAVPGPGAQPASATDIRDLLYLKGAALAPVSCTLSLGGTDAAPGMVLRASGVDVSVAADASGLHLVASVRGSPVLPRDGAWTLARLGAADKAPKALDPTQPIPLVSPNASLAGAGRWHLADPGDITRLGDTASPDTRYSLVQSLGAQKVLFDRPRIGNDPAPITLPQPPKLADMGALLHAVSVFPGLADAFDFKSLKALKVADGALAFHETFPIGNGQLSATLLDLGGSDALAVRIEYHDEVWNPSAPDPAHATVATLTVDPAASPRWSIQLGRVCFAVVFRGAPLISIFATLTADEHSAPSVADIRVRYEGVLNVLQTLFSSIEQVARFLPGGSDAGLKVGFSQGHLTVRNEFALPSLPLGAGQITDVAVEMGFEVALSPVALRFVAGLGSEQKPFRWIVSPLAGTGVVQVGVGTAGLDILVQAGLGVGLAIDLGIASGSASVALAIELNTDPDPFELKAILSGRASVDVLQGLASATITLAAGLGIIPPKALFLPPFLPPQLIPPPDKLPPLTVGLVASVSAGIHLSVCWVVDVDWEGYWQFRQDITTPALPLPI